MNTTARFQLHVPLMLPEGVVTPAGELEAIETLILALGTGFTSHEGRGQWRDEAEALHDEPVRVYVFDVEDGYATGPDVQKIAKHVAVRLKQKAVYMTWQPLNGGFVTA